MLKKVESHKSPMSDNTKLEDVLKSIRGIIDDRNDTISTQDSLEDTILDKSVLELTNIVSSSKDTAHTVVSNDNLIAENTRTKTESEINKLIKALNNSEESISEKSLDTAVNQLMRPLIKNWLDNNLPRIVETIVSEEIQKIVQKP